ncbi:MAG TPA: DNA polymerase III subunit delta [Candidatus Hypogeohydataceae bacterium YC40]
MYLVYGEEEFFVKEALSFIKSRLLTDDSTGPVPIRYVAGLTEMDGEETSLSTVLEEVRTPPLFGKGVRKLVIVYNAERLFKEGRGVWENYLASPPEDSVLVLVCKEVDSKDKTYEKLRRKGGSINCRRLKEDELGLWIQERVRHYGKQITLDALHILQENIGSKLLLLDGQIAKLALYLGSRNRIEVSDAEELVGYDRQHKVFDFTGAVARRDATLALRILHQLMAFMKSGEEAQTIIPPLAWQFRRLIRAKRLLSSGEGREAVASELRVPYRFLQDLVNQTQLFSKEELERDYKFLLETDIRSKTDNVDARLLLETLVFKFCK